MCILWGHSALCPYPWPRTIVFPRYPRRTGTESRLVIKLFLAGKQPPNGCRVYLGFEQALDASRRIDDPDEDKYIIALLTVGHVSVRLY